MSQLEEVKKLMDSQIKKAIDANEVAGMNVLVYKDGKEMIYTQGGYADIDENKDFNRNTIFRLYSQSKPVTSAAVMKLMEDGIIDITEPVSKYIEGFKDQYYMENGKMVHLDEPMMIYHLLSMTSGLCYPAIDNVNGCMVDQIFKEADSKLYTDQAMTTMELANRIGKCTLSFKPGTDWMYGTSADILGAVIESASGMKFSEYLKKNFFEPLEMKDTAFYVPSEKQNLLARSYETVWGENGNNKLIEYTGDNLLIMNRMKTEPAFESGGAGLASTIDDYMHFAQMLLNDGKYKGKQILKPETIKYMTNTHLREGSDHGLKLWTGLAGYSYGNLLRVADRPDVASYIIKKGEYGWDGWLGPYFANFPEENITILMGMQKRDAGTWDLTRKLRNIILTNLL
ncbi:MAG: beta-lactamase family protein [Butyrivibrio sp.]|nr:beta-lactamase family protein [Butyrivibrio sp.]